MQVGFVGLGDMGGAIARRLASSLAVTVWARDPAVAAEFDHVAPRLEALGACDVVGVCVSDDDAVRDVVGRVLPALAAGTVVVVHSTVRPTTVVELGRRCAARGAALVDAPVSGGSDAAARGDLVVLVGGEEPHIAKARPVLGLLGEIHVVGAVGAGQTTKILNNALYTANAALAAQVLDLAEGRSMPRAPVAEGLARGSGASFALTRLERLRDPERAGTFARLLEKDLDLFDEIVGAGGRVVSATGRALIARLRETAGA